MSVPYHTLLSCLFYCITASPHGFKNIHPPAQLRAVSAHLYYTLAEGYQSFKTFDATINPRLYYIVGEKV